MTIDSPNKDARLDLAGASVLTAVVQLRNEQNALFENASLDQGYQAFLAVYVEAKHNQAALLEDRLQVIIACGHDALDQLQENPPGLLARPAMRRAWKAGQTRLQSRLSSLHRRLDAVHEIKEGMGLHSPRIEELATRRLQIKHPELAAAWSARREQERRQHVQDVRRQDPSRKSTKKKARARTQGIAPAR